VHYGREQATAFASMWHMQQNEKQFWISITFNNCLRFIISAQFQKQLGKVHVIKTHFVISIESNLYNTD